MIANIKLTLHSDGNGTLKISTDGETWVDLTDATIASSIELVALTAPRPRSEGPRYGLRVTLAAHDLDLDGEHELILDALFCDAYAAGMHDTERCALPPPTTADTSPSPATPSPPETTDDRDLPQGGLTMPTTDRVEITRADTKNPDLLAKLEVKPPRKHPDEDPESWKGRMREDWTLASVERTCLELRAAGAWDDSKVTLGYRDGGSIECEILAHQGQEVLPWGWVPAHGAPPGGVEKPAQIVVPPAELSVRAQRFALGIGALMVVDMLVRLIGWVF